MPLAAGQKLGPYEVVSQLGAGGMGEVYRARDTKLKRDVAIKVLPADVAGDRERLARFQREAEVLASLNHPHIAHVYGIEDGALVMELVEGEDLSARIARGPLPLDEALPIARQIAEALEAAHEAGIVHRDLKPGNVKVRDDGTVKVLDFGLAKELGTAHRRSTDLANSPTITSPAMTVHGVLLGTAAYMAPEQAKGKPVDKRADIWAFGAVLYEMLTGRRAFDGEDVSETLASVLRTEPDYSALSPEIPAPLRAVVKRCLTKDVRQRTRDIGDVRIQLDEIVRTADATARSASPAPSWRWLVAVTAVAVLLAAGTAFVAWSRATVAPAGSALRGTLDLEVPGQVWTNLGPGAVLSPDGTTLAVAVDQPGRPNQIFLRRLDQMAAVPLAGTEGARNIFFSPDGQSIAFFADGKLKRVPISGGTPTTLADAPDDRGGAWGEDGTIVFAPNSRSAIHRVRASGGAIEEVTRVGTDETAHRWPQVLPCGRGILFTLVRSSAVQAIAIQPRDGGEHRILQEQASFGRLVPSGHLLFMRGDTVYAAPLDLASLTHPAAPVPVLEGVRHDRPSGGAQIAFSDSGGAVYVKGSASAGRQMIWLDANGLEQPIAAPPAQYSDPRLSPDGTKVASTKQDASADVWVYDLQRGTDSRLTFENTNEIVPLWTPDGRFITYGVIARDAPPSVYWTRADGSGTPQLLVRDTRPLIPFSWHPNGRVLAMIRQEPENIADVVITEFSGDERTGLKAGPLVTFAGTGFAEQEPAFSPDGRWLAYQSNESGRFEIYVSGYPGPSGRWQVSNGGGVFPTWGPDGRTLYYRSPEQQIMAVSFTVTDGVFSAAAPVPWSPTRLDDLGLLVRTFDVHPDGKRMFAIRVPLEERMTSVRVTLISDLLDELRMKVPTAR
jgi:Tol biopolymer transport system component